jgi:hypothetical protein
VLLALLRRFRPRLRGLERVGRRVRGLGPGLTSESADAARAVLTNLT